MIVRSRAPLRLGLAGGGTDVSPYCDELGGAVLNVTIDMYAYTIIEPTDDGMVTFKASDIDGLFEARAEDAMEVAYPLILHRAVYRRIVTSSTGAGRSPATSRRSATRRRAPASARRRPWSCRWSRRSSSG